MDLKSLHITMPPDKPQYVISLDNFDLSLLRNYDRSTEVPLWSLQGSEYMEFEVFSQEVPSDPVGEELENLHNQRCHICEVDTPVLCFEAHIMSEKHQMYAAIAHTGMERLQKQMAAYSLPLESCVPLSSTYYCESCARVVNRSNQELHNASKEHAICVNRDVMMKKFMLVYQEPSNFKNVFEEFRMIAEKGEGAKEILSKIEKKLDWWDEVFLYPKKVNPTTAHKIHYIDDYTVEVSAESGAKLAVAFDNFHGFSEDAGKVLCRVCRILIGDKYTHMNDDGHIKRVTAAIVDKHCIRQLDRTLTHCILCNEIIENREHHVVCEKHACALQQALIDDEVYEHMRKDFERYDTNINTKHEWWDEVFLYPKKVNPTTAHKIHYIDDYTVEVSAESGAKLAVAFDNFHGFSEDAGKVLCRVCRILISDKYTHMNDDGHIKRVTAAIVDKHCIRQLDQILNHCILCNEIIENSESHILKEKHETALKDSMIDDTDEVKQTLAENFMSVSTFNKNVYSCNACQIYVEHNNLKQHIDQGYHVESVRKLSLRGLDKQLKNKVKSSEHCATCNVLIQGGKKARRHHKKSEDHRYQDWLRVRDTKIHYHLKKIRSVNNATCNVCKISISTDKTAIDEHLACIEHQSAHKNLLQENKMKIKDQKYILCYACDTLVLIFDDLKHIIKKVHRKNLAKSQIPSKYESVAPNDPKEEKQNQSCVVNKEDCFVFCKVCGVSIERKDLDIHINCTWHLENIASELKTGTQENKATVIDEEDDLNKHSSLVSMDEHSIIDSCQLFADKTNIDGFVNTQNQKQKKDVFEGDYCTICKMRVRGGEKYIKNHIRFSDHRYMKYLDEMEMGTRYHYHMKLESANKLACKVCKIEVEASTTSVLNHIESNKHRAQYREVTNNLLTKISDTRIKCTLCDISLLILDEINHLTGKRHKRNLREHGYASNLLNFKTNSLSSDTSEKLISKEKLHDNNLVKSGCEYYCDTCCVTVEHNCMDVHVDCDLRRNNLSKKQLANDNEVNIQQKNIVLATVAPERKMQPLHYVYEFDKDFKDVKCKVCNIGVAFNYMVKHRQGNSHKKNFKDLVTVNTMFRVHYVSFCECCIDIVPLNLEYEHLTSEEHVRNLSNVKGRMHPAKLLEIAESMFREYDATYERKKCRKKLTDRDSRFTTSEDSKQDDEFPNETLYFSDSSIACKDPVLNIGSDESENCESEDNYSHLAKSEERIEDKETLHFSDSSIACKDPVLNIGSDESENCESEDNYSHFPESEESKEDKETLHFSDSSIACKDPVLNIGSDESVNCESEDNYSHLAKSEERIEDKETLHFSDSSIACKDPVLNIGSDESENCESEDNYSHFPESEESKEDKETLHFSDSSIACKDPVLNIGSDESVNCESEDNYSHLAKSEERIEDKKTLHFSDSSITCKDPVLNIGSDESVNCETEDNYSHLAKSEERIEDKETLHFSDSSIACKDPVLNIGSDESVNCESEDNYSHFPESEERIEDKETLHFSDSSIACKDPVLNIGSDESVNCETEDNYSHLAKSDERIEDKETLHFSDSSIACKDPVLNIGSDESVNCESEDNYSHFPESEESKEDKETLHFSDSSIACKDPVLNIGSDESVNCESKDNYSHFPESEESKEDKETLHFSDSSIACKDPVLNIGPDESENKQSSNSEIFPEREIKSDNTNSYITSDFASLFLKANSEQLICQVCDCFVSMCYDLFIEHVQGMKHTIRYEALLLKNVIKESVDSQKETIKNYHCFTCGTDLLNSHLFPHLSSDSHRNNLLNSQPSTSREQQVLPHDLQIVSKIHRTYFMEESYTDLFCKLCDSEVPSKRIEEHIRNYTHQARAKAVLHENEIRKVGGLILCDLCNVSFKEGNETEIEHIFSDNHKKNIEILALPKTKHVKSKVTSSISYLCDICNVYILGSENVIKLHNEGKRHRINSLKLVAHSQTKAAVQNGQPPDRIPIKIYALCKICKMKYEDNPDEKSKHEGSPFHKRCQEVQAQTSKNNELRNTKDTVTEPQNAGCSNSTITEPQNAGCSNSTITEPQNAGCSNSTITEPQNAGCSNNMTVFNFIPDVPIYCRCESYDKDPFYLVSGLLKNSSIPTVVQSQCSKTSKHITQHKPQDNLQSKYLTNDYCSICSAKVAPANVAEHLLGARHRENVAKKAKLNENKITNQITQAKSQKKVQDFMFLTNGYCSICSAKVAPANVAEHLLGAKHRENAAIVDKINLITTIKSSDYANHIINGFCAVCKVSVPNGTANIAIHVNGSSHKQNVAIANKGKTTTNSEYSDHTNHIINGFCTVCKANLPKDSANIAAHVKGANHNKNVAIANKGKTTINSEYSEHTNHIINGFCTVCKANLPKGSANIAAHIKGANHNKNVAIAERSKISTTESRIKEFRDICNAIPQTNEQFCTICNVKVSNSIQHLASAMHKKNSGIAEMFDLTDTNERGCKICDVIVPNTPDNMSEHLQGQRHKKNAQTKTKPGDVTAASSNKTAVSSNNNDANVLYCNICQVKMSDDNTLKSHLTSKRHKNIFDNLTDKQKQEYLASGGMTFQLLATILECQYSQSISRTVSTSNDTTQTTSRESSTNRPSNSTTGTYACQICNVTVPNHKTNIASHMKGNKHIKNVRQLINDSIKK